MYTVAEGEGVTQALDDPVVQWRGDGHWPRRMVFLAFRLDRMRDIFTSLPAVVLYF